MDALAEYQGLLIWGAVFILLAGLAVVFLPRLLQAASTEQTQDQGVIKRDWSTTGRVNFALPATMPDLDTPVSLILEVEETRVIESVTGGEMLSLRWRRATLAEAKQVMGTYWDCYEKHPELIQLRQLKGPHDPARDKGERFLQPDESPSIVSKIDHNALPAWNEGRPSKNRRNTESAEASALSP
jgi:hypothetical protein